MSTIPKTAKMATSNYNGFLKEWIDGLSGPQVCSKCEITYSRDRWGWFCPLCKREDSNVFWKDLNETTHKKISDNDKFYAFMQIKYKARNE